MMTTTELYDDAALTALIASATLLGADLKAGLYTNAITPSKTLDLTALTEPTYGSYVRQTVVMGPVVRDPSAGIAALAASLNWQQTGTPTPVNIVGIFYTYGATPKLLALEPFPTPIALTDLLDSFTTVLEYIQSSPTPGFTTIVQ